jgi:hypothetical protein
VNNATAVATMTVTVMMTAITTMMMTEHFSQELLQVMKH